MCGRGKGLIPVTFQVIVVDVLGWELAYDWVHAVLETEEDAGVQTRLTKPSHQRLVVAQLFGGLRSQDTHRKLIN